ncbi:MAG: DUF2242 domain-containing protein [Candidatus Omnitrophota bacterium]
MKRLICLLVMAISMSGCATPVYKQVFNNEPIGNSKEFSVSQDKLYQATIKALCARNFFIENEDKEKGFILGKRFFQKGKKTIVLLVQGKIAPSNENQSTLYLNAVETTEVAYVSDHTRFFMFILPLPGGGGKQATTVKQGEKTIQDKEFYSDFFKAIEEEIKKE